MDLVSYYAKVREQEQAIADEFPIVVSHASGDGGKAGQKTEVTRRVAARLLVEGAARLADAAETLQFRALQKEAKELAERAAAAASMQVRVLAASEIEMLTLKAAGAANKD